MLWLSKNTYEFNFPMDIQCQQVRPFQDIQLHFISIVGNELHVHY